MRLAAIIPLRDLASGKSRLRPILADAWRQALIIALARRVLDALVESGVATHVALIAPDPAILARVGENRAVERLHQRDQGLNAALDAATNWAQSHAAEALLVLPADLPRITPAAIRMLVAATPPAPAVCLASDQIGDGTNALLVAPPGNMPWCFGAAALWRPKLAARQRGLALATCDLPEFACDLDTPADLRDLALHWSGAVDLWRAAPAIAPTCPLYLAAILVAQAVRP